MKHVSLIATALIMGLPMAAHASVVDEDDKGFYVGAGFGQTELHVTSSQLEGSGDTHETGFKLIAGYQFSPNFKLETSYFKPGKVSESEDGDSLSLDTDILQAFIVGNAPVIAGKLDVFGKIGFSYWDSTLTASSGFQTARLKDDGTDYTWGAGVGYHITDQLSSTVEFEQTSIDAPVGDLPLRWRLRLFYATLKYRF